MKNGVLWWKGTVDGRTGTCMMGRTGSVRAGVVPRREERKRTGQRWRAGMPRYRNVSPQKGSRE